MEDLDYMLEDDVIFEEEVAGDDTIWWEWESEDSIGDEGITVVEEDRASNIFLADTNQYDEEEGEVFIPSNTLYKVMQELKGREKLGKEKYDTTVDREDLTSTEWLQHLKEELMDAVLYTQRSIDLLETVKEKL